MRLDCVICVTGPARGALGPVRFLCTLLWGFGGLAWPTLAQALGLLVPCALGQTTATNWANLRLGRSGSGALPLHLLWVFRGLGPPWHRHWVRFPVTLAKPHTHSKSHVDTSPGRSSSFLQIVFDVLMLSYQPPSFQMVGTTVTAITCSFLSQSVFLCCNSLCMVCDTS